MSFVSNAFSGSPNPADSAMPYYQQIPGMEHQYMDPYINQGQNAYNAMNPQFNQMSQDPAAFINALMSKYTPSAEFTTTNKYLTQNAANTAAAGGMRGSANDIANQNGLTNRLLSSDMQSWLQRVLGVQSQGLSGEENEYNMGYGAADHLSDALGTNLSNEGQLAFQGQREENQRKQDSLGSIFSGLGTIAGYALGGPMGAMAGHMLGGSMTGGSASGSNANSYSNDDLNANYNSNPGVNWDNIKFL